MRASLKTGLAIGLAVSGFGLSVPPAQAAYIVTLTQAGSNVVATGSGTIDLAALSFDLASGFAGGITPDVAFIVTGPASAEPVDAYTGFTGPKSFGSGGISLAGVASSGVGDTVGIGGTGGDIFVPQGYVSGSPLSDSSTYDNQSFSSLGVTPGIYVYTFGSGANADSFTVDIAAAPVPEPISLALLGTGLFGLGLVARRRQTEARCPQ